MGQGLLGEQGIEAKQVRTVGMLMAQGVRSWLKVQDKNSVTLMSLPTAIKQMELLEHDFFLFFNAEAAELHLLYRRRDGNYGLIEPELE